MRLFIYLRRSIIQLIVKDNSVRIADGDKIIYNRENCSQNEIRDILNHIGAYQKKQYLGFGKPKWILPKRFTMMLETELF